MIPVFDPASPKSGSTPAPACHIGLAQINQLSGTLRGQLPTSWKTVLPLLLRARISSCSPEFVVVGYPPGGSGGCGRASRRPRGGRSKRSQPTTAEPGPALLVSSPWVQDERRAQSTQGQSTCDADADDAGLCVTTEIQPTNDSLRSSCMMQNEAHTRTGARTTAGPGCPTSIT